MQGQQNNGLQARINSKSKQTWQYSVYDVADKAWTLHNWKLKCTDPLGNWMSKFVSCPV